MGASIASTGTPDIWREMRHPFDSEIDLEQLGSLIGLSLSTDNGS